MLTTSRSATSASVMPSGFDPVTIEAAILAQLREEYADSPDARAQLSEHHTESTVKAILMDEIEKRTDPRTSEVLDGAQEQGLDLDDDEVVDRVRRAAGETLAATDTTQLIADVVRRVQEEARLAKGESDA